jgi:hypothetical protein
VAVAQVIGGAGQREGVGAAGLEQVFRRRDHLDHPPVGGLQPVAAAQDGARGRNRPTSSPSASWVRSRLLVRASKSVEARRRAASPV